MTTDTLNFLESVAALPEQFANAHRRAGAIDPDDFPSAEGVANIVVCGLGASGIVGDVLAASSSGELSVPVIVSKQIRTPGFVGADSLVFAVSYDGESPETVAMARGALEAGARVVAISAGGTLASLATGAPNALHISCAGGLESRAALGEVVVPVFVTLFRMGMLASAHDSLRTTEVALTARRNGCVDGIVAPANPAKEIARKIGRTIPLIYGGGALGGVAAYRWKCDINETAKAPAFTAQFPELGYNEVSAWGQHGDVTRQLISLIEVRHGFEHAQLGRQFDAARAIIDEALHQVISVEAAGESRLAQLLDLMYLGDWVSCYLALQNDVDPGPVEATQRLRDLVAIATGSPSQ